MKTITSLVAAVLYVAGATGAFADQQRSDEAPGYALSQQEAHGSSGAYAWAPDRGQVRNQAVETPQTYDYDYSGIPAAR
jgi:hypothetical protein